MDKANLHTTQQKQNPPLKLKQTFLKTIPLTKTKKPRTTQQNLYTDGLITEREARQNGTAMQIWHTGEGLDAKVGHKRIVPGQETARVNSVFWRTNAALAYTGVKCQQNAARLRPLAAVASIDFMDRAEWGKTGLWFVVWWFGGVFKGCFGVLFILSWLGVFVMLFCVCALVVGEIMLLRKFQWN